MTTTQKRWLIQKPIGILFLIMSYILWVVVGEGSVLGDNDASFLFFTVPLGLWCLFSKKYLLTF